MTDAAEPDAPTPEPAAADTTPAPAPRRRQRRIVDVDGDVAELAKRVAALEDAATLDTRALETFFAERATKIIHEALAGVSITVVELGDNEPAAKGSKAKAKKAKKTKAKDAKGKAKKAKKHGAPKS
jgi:hypothetical protein